MLVQLQYIRALAALLVVYFHAILQLRTIDPSAVLGVALFGKSGVDVFFVLSGFVMWVTTSGKPITALQFYGKRIRRIVPLYWAVTLAAAAVALVAPQILKSTVFDAQHVAASLAFLPWINPADPEGRMIAPVIVPGWTLNYEMYFYLIFGALLFIRPRFRLALLVATLAAIAALCSLASMQTTATTFYGNPIVFEFAAGAVLGLLYLRGFRIGTTVAVALAVVSTALLLVFDFLELPHERLLTIGLPAVLIVFAMTSIDFTRVRELRLLRFLGDASYSIYLTHIFVLAGWRMAYSHLPEGILTNQYILVASMLLASCIVGGLVHLMFELPVDRYLSGRKPPKPAAEPAFALAGNNSKLDQSAGS
ncbi:exopolysaccharide production protein ExoZ [Hoeflea marina]|uniref:Exopolysaccharide production protein ExoZ n=1 Tax=Hoeflea marina TaxID=274592 RepID=A0A317PG75_9HYPH|nr:acyltransferase [Hoeflea marina]PWV99191.1 exopolysaccharide production protein ExoZ [Hoeflea marina]